MGMGIPQQNQAYAGQMQQRAPPMGMGAGMGQ